MAFNLPPLPYDKTALTPLMSEETLNYHYGKHHATYVSKLNDAIAGGEFEEMALEAIIRNADGGIFNNAAQVWNHTFFWQCLTPDGSGEPDGKLAAAITEKWQSFEKFKEAFTQSAIANFGSGWTWLVVNDAEELAIMNTANAETPAADPGIKALLTVDVWEHAYYIDYRNARPSYLNAFWALVDWSFVEARFTQSEPSRDMFPFTAD